MRFRYASYEVDPSPTVPGGVIYRPEVAIDVIGPRRVETIQAIVDTGSDETVFPASLAKVIGVQLDYALAGHASAVGGHAVELIPGSVVLEIPPRRCKVPMARNRRVSRSGAAGRRGCAAGIRGIPGILPSHLR